MEKIEANKIIAEYMGGEYHYISDVQAIYFGQVQKLTSHAVFKDQMIATSPVFSFTESLDALVPVWERLEVFPQFGALEGCPIVYKCRIHIECHKLRDDAIGLSGWVDSLKEAAAIATARAIEELKK